MTFNTTAALKKMLLKTMVGAVLIVSYAGAEEAIRSEFLTCDQPLLFFTAVKGGKYPTAMKFNPATTDFQTISFGTYHDGSITLVKEAADLATMIPVRSVTKNIYAGVQLDKKYKGFRETVGGKAVESTFKTLGLMPSSGYKGVPLVDEYLAGCPMKVVVSNAAYLNGLIEYLDRCFKAKIVLPKATKPLMLLNVLEQVEDYSAALAFLDQYFEVVDAQDPAVKKFFSAAQQAIYDAIDKTKDAKVVGESLGETLLGMCEEKVKLFAKDFDMQKFATYLALLGGGYMAHKYAQPEVDKKIDEYFKVDKKDKDDNIVKDKDGNVIREFNRDYIKYAMFTGSASVAAFLVYCMATADKQESEVAEIYKA